MTSLHHPIASGFSIAHQHCGFRTHIRHRTVAIRSSISLPFSEDRAKYYDHLQAAVDIVERACLLCADVQKSLLSRDEEILEKMDRTPVTIADYGVQALVSLEMGKLFPSIPLVAEEDSSFLQENNLVGAVVDVVTNKLNSNEKYLSQNDVIKAIDRGGRDAYLFGPEPATYWVLDPIDGTHGFIKGSRALYVVGLALIVKGDIVLGVMGCPNWQYEQPNTFTYEDLDRQNAASRSGIIMISHSGCGTWRKRLWHSDTRDILAAYSWTRCFVDSFLHVLEARFCISDSQKWESLPLSAKFKATANANYAGDDRILLLSTCCGSLCKYLMVASGRASIFILRSRTRRVIKVWDHAVGVICVHEAGGKVTDWEGSQLDFAVDTSERRALFPPGGVLATNNGLHAPVLELISLN